MTYVLVIDDDPGVRRLTSWALKAVGYTVFEAMDGRQGLEMCKCQLPAAIVLDVQMPVMDGPSFFEAIDGADRPPVVIVSAHGAERVSRELGAEASLAKPFDPIELSDLIVELAPLA